ncbi:unnamed protein product [Rotaria sp. Silwood1]|nr:unnamed protein product [Rotaria sp. Silwood1]
MLRLTIFFLLIWIGHAKESVLSSQELVDLILANEPDKLAALDDYSLLSDLFDYYQIQHHSRRPMLKSDLEKDMRMENFKETLKFIIKTNSDEENTFKLSLNEFSDWTQAELRHHTGLIPDNSEHSISRLDTNPVPDAENFYPLNNRSDDSWDWTEHGIISPVKNQGQCGGCYAFAFVGVLESNYAIRHKILVNMSEQEFIDCTATFGCKGGNFIPCYNYVKTKNWRTQRATHYPYMAVNGQCQLHQSMPVHIGEKLYKRAPTNDEVALKTLLRKYGPMFIAFNVGNQKSASSLQIDISKKFNSYSSGIFDVPGCNERPLQNHAMLLVGYGHDKITGLDYWKVKNSWSTRWGENGFIRIRRGVNMGGIATNAYYIGSLSLS